MRAMNVLHLSEELKKYNVQFGEEKEAFDQIPHEKFTKLVELAQSRIETLKQFYPLIKHFFPNATFTVENEQDRQIAQSLQSEFQKINSWNKDEILEALRVVLKNHSIRMPVLYTIVTGQERGLPLPESLEIMGKEVTSSRLKQALI